MPDLDSIQPNNALEMESPPDSAWSSSVRFWVSIALAIHLFVVVLAPIATVPPRPQLALDAQRVVAPYSEALFLQHGYRFFAPEPGPSHIVQYKLFNNDGGVVEGRFPDRDRYWPRLRYHRWFMLSETLALHVAGTLDPRQLNQWREEVAQEIQQVSESDPRLAQRMDAELRLQLSEHQRMAEVRDQMVADIGQWLLHQHPNSASVELKMLTRVLPPPQEIERGMKIDAEVYLPEDLVVVLGTVTRGADQLESILPEEESGPAAGPQSNPASGSSEQRGRGGRP